MAFVPPIIDFNFKISGDEEIRRRFSDAGSQVGRRVHGMLEYLAAEVAMRARARAPRSSRTGSGKRLADFIGYRFTMGKSGIKPSEGDRVVIRSDIGARGKYKAKAYAVEMGQIGRRKQVQAHTRKRFGRRGSGGRRGGPIPSGLDVPVSAYTRRFANRAIPFMGPAGDEMRPAIEQALTVALPRQLARLMAGEGD